MERRIKFEPSQTKDEGEERIGFNLLLPWLVSLLETKLAGLANPASLRLRDFPQPPAQLRTRTHELAGLQYIVCLAHIEPVATPSLMEPAPSRSPSPSSLEPHVFNRPFNQGRKEPASLADLPIPAAVDRRRRIVKTDHPILNRSLSLSRSPSVSLSLWSLTLARSRRLNDEFLFMNLADHQVRHEETPWWDYMLLDRGITKYFLGL